MQALVTAGLAAQPAAAGPRTPSVSGYPTVGYDVAYDNSAVLIWRTEAAAEDSFAAILARSRFGIAIAAMIRMIATTISSSISEKPFCFRILIFVLFFSFRFVDLGLSDPMQSYSHLARHPS